jgi:uncharacterized protein (DUF2252 family)
MGLTAQRFVSRAERIEAGRALRERVPRSSHCDWTPAPDRADPIDLLDRSNAGRAPELVPIRYGRMLQNPFAFLRGSPVVMTADLAANPATGLQVQACGDCHLFNLGIFGTPERNVVFGLNDFDETLPGPWEWDLKRLAASFVVAGRQARLAEADNRLSAETVGRSYRERMWVLAGRSPLEIWYDRIDLGRAAAEAPDERARRTRERLIAKAQQRVGEMLFPKMVRSDGGRMKIVDQPPLIFHPADLDADNRVRKFLSQYRESLADDRRVLFDRYHLEDVALKVVGIGSVGTYCFAALFSSADGAPLFLQVKEANPSVLEPYAGKSEYNHAGQRVVIGQRLLQAASDIFLGWGTGVQGREFYVRQLRDMKLSVPLLEGHPIEFRRYAGFCGWALARAHANTGDAAALAGYMGHRNVLDKAIGQFAITYADQTERDHATLLEAYRDARVEAIEDSG